MATVTQIQEAASRYAAARQILVDTALAMQRDIDQIRAKYIGGLKINVATAKARHTELYEAVSSSPEHFVKPRTVIFHGVKVGFEKAKGKIVIDDADVDKVVRLIKKHFPEQADVLINTTEKPAKKALANLTVADLKKLGIEVADTGDVVVIKDTGAEVEKLIAAFLKDDDAQHDDDAAREALAA